MTRQRPEVRWPSNALGSLKAPEVWRTPGPAGEQLGHGDAGGTRLESPKGASVSLPSRGKILRSNSSSQTRLPTISPLLLGWFRWYSRGYVRRHFHTVRIGGHTPVDAEKPLVAFVNHASWWDPMMLFLVGEKIAPARRAYAPIDAEALKRYAMFKRMGLFGVEQNTPRGAIEFLRTSQSILAAPDTVLWLTPQGRFCDVRERPVKFHGGLGALAKRSHGTCFLPVAMEYAFWEERLPEVLIWIGKPFEGGEGRERSSEAWTQLFESRLQEAQEQLAECSINRDTTRLQTVLEGGSGVGRFYDVWRSMRARLRGERFIKDHGNL